jgi:TP901 family phage tail tape measure protein
MRRSIGLFGGSVKPLGATIRSTNNEINSIASAFNAPSRALSSFSQQAVKLGNNISSVGNAISGLGVKMLFLVSLPLAAGFIGAAVSAATFETSMVKIINLTNVTEAGVQQLTKAVLDMSVGLAQAPGDLAEALFSITSAGLTDVASATEVLKQSARAASIGLGETEDVARALVGILEVYGGTINDVVRYTDQLVAIVNEGNLEAEKLAPTLGRVTGFAAALGVEFDELGAFIAAFSRSGVPAEVTITSLRSVMSSLIKPTEGAKDTLIGIGTSIEEVRAAIADPGIGLAKTLIALTALLGKTDTNMAEVIGNVRGLAGALFVTGNVADNYLQIQENIANSAGVTAEGFERVAQTTEFQWKQLIASFQVLATTVGQILLPAFNSIIQKLLPLVAGLVEFVRLKPNVIAMGLAFTVLAIAIPPILLLVGTMIGAVGSIITMFGTFAGVIAAVISPLGLLGAAIAIVAGLFLFALPKMQVSARAMAISASADFVMLRKNVKKAVNGLPPLATSAMEGFRDEMRFQGDTAAREGFGWGGNIIIQFAKGMAAAAIAVVTVLNQIGKIISDWLSPGSPPKLLPDLPAWGQSAMNEFMQGWLLADFSVFKDISSTIGGFLSSLGEGVIDPDKLPSAIMGMRDALAQAIEQFRITGSVSDEAVGKIISGFGMAGENIRNYIRSMLELNTATESLRLAQEALNEVNRQFEDAVRPIDDELDAIGDRRKDIIDDMREEELAAIVGDPRANDLVRELALMELREIELGRQRRSEEDLRDEQAEGIETTIRAAEIEVERLRAQAELYKASIDAQTENNDLLKRQASLLEDVAKKIAAVGASLKGVAGAGGGLDLGENGKDPLGLKKLFGNIAKTKGIDIEKKIQDLVDAIKKPFEPLLGEEGLLRELQNTWANVFTSLGIDDIETAGLAIWSLVRGFIFLKAIIAGAGLITSLLSVAAGMRAIGVGAFLLAGAFALLPIAVVLGVALLLLNIDKVKAVFEGPDSVFGVGGIGEKALQATSDALVTWLEETSAGIGTWASDTTESFNTWSEENDATIITWSETTTASFNAWDTSTSEKIQAWNERVSRTFFMWSATTLLAIVKWWVNSLRVFILWAKTTTEKIETTVEGWITALGEGVTGFYDAGVDVMDGFADGLESKLEDLKGTIRSIFGKLRALWEEQWGLSSPSKVTTKYGMDVNRGWINGLDSMLPALEQAADRVGLALATGLSGPGSIAAPGRSRAGAGIDNRVGAQFGDVQINNGMDYAIFKSNVESIVDGMIA